MGSALSRRRPAERPSRPMRPAGADGDGDSDEGAPRPQVRPLRRAPPHVHTWECFRYFAIASGPPGDPPMYRVHIERPYSLQEIASGAWVPLTQSTAWTNACRRGVEGADARVIAFTIAGRPRAPPLPAADGSFFPVEGFRDRVRRAFGGRDRLAAFRGGGALPPPYAWEGNLSYLDPWLVILRPPGEQRPPQPDGSAEAANDRERCRLFGRATGAVEMWGVPPYRRGLRGQRSRDMTPPPAYS